MSEKKKKSYVHQSNAVCVTLYSPTGDDIPQKVVQEITDLASEIANHHRLLVNFATT
jgi:hypothetical protein